MDDLNATWEIQHQTKHYISFQLSSHFQLVWHKVGIEAPELNAGLISHAKNLTVAKDLYL